MGANVLPEWRICRITGPALEAYRDAIWSEFPCVFSRS
jgi:hypothetical protein